LSFHYLPVVLSTAKTWGDHANYCQIMASWSKKNTQLPKFQIPSN
jgi:hypothetical protein